MTEYKLKDISETIEAKEKVSDKKVEYKIEYKNKDGKDKIEIKEGKGTATITAKIKRKTEGNDKEEDLGEKPIEIKVKEGKTVGFSGISSFRMTFWIMIIAGAMLKRLVAGESFDSFLQNNQDKTVLVKFFTDWCGPCKTLQESIKKLLTEWEQAKEKKDLVVLEIDAEKFPELARRPDFNVYSVPALFLFRKGKMVKKGGGSLNVPQLKDFLAQISIDLDKLPGGVVQLVEHRPSDPIVVGSSPAASAKLFAHIAQLVDAAGLRSVHGENEVILREEPEESKFDMKIFDNNNVEIEADKIEYLLKSSSDWEPIKEGKKIKIKSGKKSEFDKVIKEAHKKLLKQRFSDDHFGVSKRVDHGNDIQFNIIEDENKKEIEINFYKKDGDANVAPLRIGESQIYIEPEYYPSKKITYEEGQQEIYDEAEGEREQEKKQYQTVSTSSQNISNSSCSNCNPFYTGTLASEISVGAVEKFRQREQKVKAKV
ncbi:8734_t:CDS:2 [Gigaspora margarita]|uniref:Large ribosomal subunit protein bL31c n=1 Tax=Gigaspora margarita TaxID=4874 RepID=A0ABN7VJJ1_GIGMA|nr:8734_t:CDS:2 [Gigaspora margarita]